MAKRFSFDDEDDYLDESKQSFHSEVKKEYSEPKSYQGINVDDNVTNQQSDEDNLMAKKKKKFVWKWWHFVLVGLFALFIAFAVYIFILSNNDGPVYGNRCQGIATIPKDTITYTISEVKKNHSEVKDITMEIACKQLKVDIVFEDGMKTKKAKSIAEEAVQILDDAVGMSKEEGKTYSTLFGYSNNIAQFEVNLFLESENSDDFPIYGTKHVKNDEFAYTLASVKDQESKDKALNTLKDE